MRDGTLAKFKGLILQTAIKIKLSGGHLLDADPDILSIVRIV
jgi:hypothetical protein